MSNRVLTGSPGVRARHIVRADESAPGAREVLSGQWWAPSVGSIEGRQGWQGATVERRVNDHGTAQGIVLPNAAGDDGRMHRDRFAVRTSDSYRLGDEWIEFRDEDTGRPLAVVTPESARVDRTAVSLSAVDAAGLLSGFREGRVAPWTPHAPLDVIDWYSGAPVSLANGSGGSWAPGWVGSTSGGGSSSSATVAEGWRLNAVPPALTVGTANLTAPAATTGRAAQWAVDSTVRFVAWGGDGRDGNVYFRVAGLDASGAQVWGLYMAPGGIGALSLALYMGASASPLVPAYFATAAVGQDPAAAVQVEVFARDGWMFVAVDGRVALQVRRVAAATNDLRSVRFSASCKQSSVPDARTEMIVQRALVSSMRPLLRRAAPPASYRVAGAPTPGGLRGDYFLESDSWAKSEGNYGQFWSLALAPLAEPYQRRLDPQLQFDGASWMPPGPPSGRRFSVRWSGSIYLPLAERNMLLGLYGGGPGGIVGMVRMWVGTTRADRPYMDLTWAGEVQADKVADTWLREHLGTSESGWYPIVIEYAVGATAANPRLRLTYNSTSEWVPQVLVPSEHLSPYGCWDGEAGGESYREMIDTVCTSMGLRWRVQPMTLESGEFPGRLEVGASLGRDTDYVLGEDEATEYASELSAGEAVDQIVADAAGLGDTMGRDGGLSATMTDPAAVDRPWVLSRAEQLAEITEETMLRQRMSSLLALYGSPMETVAARPRGDDTLTDTFPLTGAARLFLWEPDDGIRLDLPTIGVKDQSPRKITSVTWPLRPDGRGSPSVGFRQRPKHPRAVLQRLARQTALQHRRYQGQLAERPGGMGGIGAAGAAFGDQYSRLPYTPDVVRVVLRVLTIANGAATIEINAASTGITVSVPGSYDVTAWAGMRNGDPRMIARLVGAAGVSAEYQLVGIVQI